MSTQIESLILDLVEWVMRAPRPYREVIEAWRTSCPRLTVWEDAVDRRLIVCERREDGELWVVATALGQDAVIASGRGVGRKAEPHLS